MTIYNELQNRELQEEGLQMSKHIGKEVYVKFGAFHGSRATVLKETTKKGESAFILLTKDNQQIIKRQKNTIMILPNNC